MRLSKKIAMGAGALTVGLGLLAVLGVGSAVAKAAAPTGTVTCTGDSGSITFSPPLSLNGPFKAEKATVSVTISSCTGGSSTPTKGVEKSTFSSSSNNCAALESPPATESETMIISWSPSSDGKTTAVLGPPQPVTGPGGVVGFSLTGNATGSYAGKASFYSLTNETASELSPACSSKTGLKSMEFTSGKVVM